jgi:hypothetical protein
MPDARRYRPNFSWPHEVSDLVFEQELANENKRRQALPAGRAHILHN